MDDTSAAPPVPSVPSIPPPPTAPTNHIDFAGERSVFRRLVMRGAMLELITVGFYRFWLATDMRRHLWSRTSVGGDALEYTGTAKELLIGFLFALAILVPLYLIYFLLGIEAERLRAFASLPMFLIYYVFFQFAIYRARRYRLTRTVWRGVRFWMAGSGLSYAWRAGLWAVFVSITLGIALPWRQAALEGFKMRHTSYGDLQGEFTGTGGQLFKRGWGLWLVVLGLIVLVFISGATRSKGLVAISILILYVALPFIYATYKAIEWRWWVSGIRFGPVSFESQLTRGALIGLYWKVIGWSCLLLIAVLAWGGGIAAGAYALSGARNGQDLAVAMQQLPALVVLILGYIVAILAFWVVARIYLTHDVWRRVADSAVVHNLDAAGEVTARGELVGALGEGFADSLDVVGF
jgi:uncharacterized membrane protein YjgN (DUF898 family)